MPPSPTDDLDPVEWDARDTAIDLTPEDIEEVEAEATAPIATTRQAITPARGVETLPGYDLGRCDAEREFFARWDDLLAGEREYGARLVLRAVRAQCIEDGADERMADAIVAALAKRVGVKPG